MGNIWCLFGHDWSLYAGYEEKFPASTAVCLRCELVYKDTKEYKDRMAYYENISSRRHTH